MQDILRISKSWHDPVTGLNRAITLILAVVAVESSVIFLKDLNPLIPSVFFMGLARLADILILLCFSPISLKESFAPGVIKESLIMTLMAVLAGILCLMVWKTWVGSSLLRPVTRLLPQDKAALIAFYGTSCLVSPISEELVFRGILYRNMREIWNTWVCLVTVSLLFALIHFYSNGVAILPFLGSLVFCLGYEKTKSILAPMVLHVCGNLVIYLSPVISFI